MNCYNHIVQSAVAQCLDCGKGLCPECASCYSIPICNTCNKRRISGERSRIIQEMALTFGMGLVLTILALYYFYESPVKVYVIFGVIFFYVFSGIVPGWKTLTYITPNVFLFLPLIGWLLFFLVKFILAIAVGVIMLPIKTIRNIYRLKALKKISV